MDHKIFHAHGIGVNSVSWAPSSQPGSLVSANAGGKEGGVRRFVTGGSDNLLRVWGWDQASLSYKVEGAPLQGHGDWVRDVAWSPTVLQKSMFPSFISIISPLSTTNDSKVQTADTSIGYIASASQDKTVRIWTSSAASSPGQWESKVLQFEREVWRVSWSLSGNVLAVSGGDNKVSLWKENLRGEWECVKEIEE